jgi:hypothetical protein
MVARDTKIPEIVPAIIPPITVAGKGRLSKVPTFLAS